MRVADLIAGTGAVLVQGSLDRTVTGLVSDSRKVVAGALFAALPGTTSDGAAFVPAAAAVNALERAMAQR